MDKQYLHIISFAIPYPANYGGVIDVFYKLKALHKCGIKVILHCFQYDDRKPAEELKKYCVEVNYYKREMSWNKAMGTIPFIVASRNNPNLINRLKKDDYPIFFEGMHTIGIVNYPAFKNRKMAVRMHNIEWEYYQQLALQEKSWTKKLYFKLESLRLKHFKHQLSHIETLFTISKLEHKKLSDSFQNCVYLPVFHKNKKVKSLKGKGKYILYHGNLEVAENKKVVESVLTKLASNVNLKLPVIIAGKGNLSDYSKYENIQKLTFIFNPSDKRMDQLIEEAQIHLLFTNQNTGIKLKLINSIYNGRHIVANSSMVKETGVESLCHVVKEKDDIVGVLNELTEIEIDDTTYKKRSELLIEEFDPNKSAQLIIEWLNPLP